MLLNQQDTFFKHIYQRCSQDITDGLNIYGSYLNQVPFADDFVLISSNLRERKIKINLRTQLNRRFKLMTDILETFAMKKSNFNTYFQNNSKSD